MATFKCLGTPTWRLRRHMHTLYSQSNHLNATSIHPAGHLHQLITGNYPPSYPSGIYFYALPVGYLGYV